RGLAGRHSIPATQVDSHSAASELFEPGCAATRNLGKWTKVTHNVSHYRRRR
ncbi:unnamed protein product, partial [Amoebophrya sp. A120]